MTTLFDKLGGANAIDAVVDKFYEFMLVDPEINHFFQNTDMNKQRMRQKQFITMVTGGPHNYEGKDMKTAHQKMKITKKDFDNTWKHLLQALRFYKVLENLISEIRDIFYSTENDIVTVKQISNQTLFQRLGGEPAINAVVDKFYEYMLSDPITSPFFANVDMKKQAMRQKQFIIMVTGGPNRYEGVDMKKAHEKFKIGKKEFDETWFNLEKSLNFFKVNQGLIGEVKAVFYSVQDDVLTVKQNQKQDQNKTLYEKLGGQAAISAVVDKFYEFMLSDPITSPFFANVDMKKQATRQKQFITMVTGGPNKYEGVDMKKAHEKFKIGKKEFDQTWYNLEKALSFFKVNKELIGEVKTVFYSVQDDVLTVKQVPKKTLYQRIGGQPALNAVVDKFYEYMLSDPITSPFFANTDMKKQATRQKQFIAMAIGGPNNYQGADMKKAHQKFKIGKREFDQTWHNLQKALAFFKVNSPEVAQIKTVFYSVQDDVLTVKQPQKPVDQKFLEFSKSALLNPNIKLFKKIIGGLSSNNPVIKPEATLYQRLGGQGAISAVIDKFYQYMLSDPITSPFFANIDMKKQATRQKQFITMVTGGPNKYEGVDMKKAHQKFKIGKKEFDQTWFNLQKALAFFKVNQGLVGEVKTIFYSVQDDVIRV